MDLDKIISSLNRRSRMYDRYAYLLLMMSWLIWLSVTIIGIVLTTTSLVIEKNELVATILGAIVTALGLLQTKYKPSKRGYLYKSSSLNIRKIVRSIQRLKNSNISPEEMNKQLEYLLDSVEDMELSLYEYGTDNTIDMRETIVE